MARNRQRAKQRQAERRARRLADPDKGDGQRARAPEAPPAEPEVDPRGPETAEGGPPEETGRSDHAIEPVTAPPDETETEEEEDVDPELAYDAEEAGALESVDEEYEPRGRRGDAYELGREVTGTTRDHPRFIQFLIHVWAELQRVQWPDRQALTTLTGVVLGFVLIAGGYLGLLDAIFSRIIQEIL